jgi:hypothetical protein
MPEQNGPGTSLDAAPVDATGLRDLVDELRSVGGELRDRAPVEEWFTVRLAAEACYRSERRILDLVARHGLRSRTGWVTHRRLKRKVILLPRSSVQWLQEVTLFKNYEALARPPR